MSVTDAPVIQDTSSPSYKYPSYGNKVAKTDDGTPGNWTMITFTPGTCHCCPHSLTAIHICHAVTTLDCYIDYARFRTSLTADLYALIHRRVHDVAACLSDHNIAVYLNDKRVPITSFTKYLELLPPPDGISCIFHVTRCHARSMHPCIL